MRGTAKIALLLLFASLTAEDSLAQRRSNRSRGLVRYSLAGRQREWNDPARRDRGLDATDRRKSTHH